MGKTTIKNTVSVTIPDTYSHLNINNFVGNHVYLSDGGHHEYLGTVTNFNYPAKGRITLEVAVEVKTACLTIYAMQGMKFEEYKNEAFYFTS